MLALIGVFSGATARAQLQWGPGGGGGSGTWNETTANWWNGSSNVAWNGGTAIFGGTGGNVVTSSFLDATGLTFNSPGYLLQSGWIDARNGNRTAFDFVVTTNQSATINSTLSGWMDTTLVKRGAATLTVSGTNFIDRVRVEAGEYRVGGSSSLFFSDVILANAPGVTLTLGSTFDSVSVRSLSGGGAAGGIVQPDSQARTVTMTVWDSGTFDGILQDNGAGKLALDLFASTDVFKLTRANRYTGVTRVSAGTLAFSGDGSAVSSPVTVGGSGILRLDNSGAALPNRLSDSAEVNLRSGRIELIGHSTLPVEEQLGALKYAGASRIDVTQAGSTAALLTFAGAERQSHATLDITGSGRVGWAGLVNRASGIAGPSITAGNEWARVGVDGRVEPLTNYATNLATATGGEHVRITSSDTALPSSATAATLNWQNQTGGSGFLNIGAGRVLALAAGGILSSGPGANEIRGGSLTSGGSELVIVNRNALTISSSIVETVSGTALVKTGAGTLTLSGSNSYSGTTAINEGVLAVGSDAALGTGSTVEFNGGILRATSSFTSAKGLTRGGDWTGVIDTAGFDVTFAGMETTALSKRGAGILRLPGTISPNISVTEGTLVLPHVASGTVSLFGGTLVASGSLYELSIDGPATLDIGGRSAAVLDVMWMRELFSSYPLTIRSGVGSSSDLLRISVNPFRFNEFTAGILFQFEDLGDVTVGNSYTLLEFAPDYFRQPDVSMFAISDVALSAGWNGTFSVDSDKVKVTFTSVPEPSSATVIGVGLLALCGMRRRRTRSRR